MKNEKYYILCSGHGTHLASDIIPTNLTLEQAKDLVNAAYLNVLDSGPLCTYGSPVSVYKSDDGLSVSVCGTGVFHAWDILPMVMDDDMSIEADLQKISNLTVALDREASSHQAFMDKPVDSVNVAEINMDFLDHVESLTSTIRSIADRVRGMSLDLLNRVEKDTDAAPLERQYVFWDRKNDTYHVGILSENGDAILDDRDDVLTAEDIGTTWKIADVIRIKKEADQAQGIFHVKAGDRYTYNPTYGTGDTMKMFRELPADVICAASDDEMWKVSFHDDRNVCADVHDNELIGPYMPKIILMTGVNASMMVQDIKMSGLRDAKFGAPRSRTFDIGTCMGRANFVTACLIDHISGPKNRWNYILHVHDYVDNFEFYVGTKSHTLSDVAALLDNIVYDMNLGRG